MASIAELAYIPLESRSAPSRHDRNDAHNLVAIFKLLVEAQFIFHDSENEQGCRDTYSETDHVYRGVGFVLRRVRKEILRLLISIIYNQI
jgi:hypothetical protein